MTIKKLGIGIVSSLMFLSIANLPAEATDYQAYDSYNECKANNRRRVVSLYFSGDWKRYDTSEQKSYWENSFHQSCNYIMEGKW